MKTLNKAAIIAALSLLACASFGFEKGRPAGAGFTPELPQEQVEKQQAYTGKYGVLGKEDLVQAKPEIKMEDESSQGEIRIESSPLARSEANLVLNQAEKEVNNPAPSRTRFFLWGGLVAVLGLVAVWMFRSYADKVVPEMPVVPTSKTKW